MHFISGLMKAGVDFVAVDMPQANKLTVHILAAVAEHEREAISQRTKAALAAAKARGTKLGNPRWQESLSGARAARKTCTFAPGAAATGGRPSRPRVDAEAHCRSSGKHRCTDAARPALASRNDPRRPGPHELPTALGFSFYFSYLLLSVGLHFFHSLF